MNPGMAIFRRHQRFQQGTDEVPWAGRAARRVQDLSIEALQNLPEWLKAPIRHGVGRVATNVVDPFGYDSMEQGISKLGETGALFSPSKLPHTLLSILQDRPAFSQSDIVQEAAANTRRPLFREYFDLPTQDVDNVYTHQGKNYRINPATKNEIAQKVLDQFTGPMYRPARLMHSPTGDYMIGSDQPGYPKTNMISRFYHPERPDPWDFAPHPDELERAKGKPLDTALFGRMLLEAIGKPAILETGGYYNPPPNEDVNPEQITGGGYQHGTSNVNPGLLLFRKKLLKKQKI